jgi:hypothetical protein
MLPGQQATRLRKSFSLAVRNLRSRRRPLRLGHGTASIAQHRSSMRVLVCCQCQWMHGADGNIVCGPPNEEQGVNVVTFW